MVLRLIVSERRHTQKIARGIFVSWHVNKQMKMKNELCYFLRTYLTKESKKNDRNFKRWINLRRYFQFCPIFQKMHEITVPFDIWLVICWTLDLFMSFVTLFWDENLLWFLSEKKTCFGPIRSLFTYIHPKIS